MLSYKLHLITRSYLSNSHVELYAFCDINEERLKFMAEKYNVKHTFTDMNEMLCIINLYTFEEASNKALQFSAEADILSPSELKDYVINYVIRILTRQSLDSSL